MYSDSKFTIQYTVSLSLQNYTQCEWVYNRTIVYNYLQVESTGYLGTMEHPVSASIFQNQQQITLVKGLDSLSPVSD